jgi:uncharacterized protein YceH (UPF0502 family)
MSDTHSALTQPLTFEQSRVLGCLLEKEVLVPDSYPLTLNTLVTACNQSTNRDPVTNFDETVVIRALDGLRETQWAFQLSQAGARVPKFKHNLHAKIHDLSPAAVAILCMLLLRGHQTAGELRQRCERMHAFPDLASIETQLEALQHQPEGPLIVCLPSGSGRRVPAYAHLFCGPVDPFSPSVTAAPTTYIVPPPAPPIDPDWKERIESELATLRAELADLKSQLGL